MPYIKWNLPLLVEFFNSYGHTLTSSSYVGSDRKYDYICKCGTENCSITIANLKQGNDNCKTCSTEKRNTTCIAKYGSQHPTANAQVKAKIAATNLERWGTTCVVKNPTIRSKIIATNIERFEPKLRILVKTYKFLLKPLHFSSYTTWHLNV